MTPTAPGRARTDEPAASPERPQRVTLAATSTHTTAATPRHRDRRRAFPLANVTLDGRPALLALHAATQAHPGIFPGQASPTRHRRPASGRPSPGHHDAAIATHPAHGGTGPRAPASTRVP